jgi:hypothetical protein
LSYDFRCLLIGHARDPHGGLRLIHSNERRSDGQIATSQGAVWRIALVNPSEHGVVVHFPQLPVGGAGTIEPDDELRGEGVQHRGVRSFLVAGSAALTSADGVNSSKLPVYVWF